MWEISITGGYTQRVPENELYQALASLAVMLGKAKMPLGCVVPVTKIAEVT